MKVGKPLDLCKNCGLPEKQCICHIDIKKAKPIERTKHKPKKRTRKEKMPARIKKGN